MVISILFIGFPDSAYANFELPALYEISGIASIWVIAIGLYIEYMAIQWITKLNTQKSLIVCLTINIISSLVGSLCYYLGWAPGFVIFMAQMGWVGFFWIPIAFIAAAVNVIIEWLALYFIFKASFGKHQIAILYIINLATVILSFGYGQLKPMTI